MARHPFAATGCKLKTPLVSIFDTSYLRIAKSRCDARSDDTAKRKAVILDMGCSVYGKKIKRAQASGLGPSMPLFESWYEDNCFAIDKIVGWEARHMNLTMWWKKVDPSTKEKLTFYNYPVTPEHFEKTLLETAAADKYVVVKLDIDHPQTEHKIMEVVEKRANLVDELFFEYHFWFDSLNFGWGNLNSIKSTRNVDTALRHMERLRRKGIRAHFWV